MAVRRSDDPDVIKLRFWQTLVALAVNLAARADVGPTADRLRRGQTNATTRTLVDYDVFEGLDLLRAILSAEPVMDRKGLTRTADGEGEHAQVARFLLREAANAEAELFAAAIREFDLCVPPHVVESAILQTQHAEPIARWVGLTIERAGPAGSLSSTWTWAGIRGLRASRGIQWTVASTVKRETQDPIEIDYRTQSHSPFLHLNSGRWSIRNAGDGRSRVLLGIVFVMESAWARPVGPRMGELFRAVVSWFVDAVREVVSAKAEGRSLTLQDLPWGIRMLRHLPLA